MLKGAYNKSGSEISNNIKLPKLILLEIAIIKKMMTKKKKKSPKTLEYNVRYRPTPNYTYNYKAKK